MERGTWNALDYPGGSSQMIENTTSHIEETIQRIEQSGVIAILRGDFSIERILGIAETLVRNGISILEITLNSAGALEAIGVLQQEFRPADLLVGAGTVRTLEQFDLALKTGAAFTVAPTLDRETVEQAARLDVIHLPGVMTPSEVEEASRLGSRLVKLFPADFLGPGYLKALRAPLDEIGFVPTGGIGPENLPDYVRAGARAVGVGGSLISGPDQDMVEIQSRTRALREAWDRANA